MGEYFEWVNVDKKEYLSPFDFNLGCKINESSVDGNPVLNALARLMDDRWKCDRIIFLGDQIEIPDDIENAVLKDLHDERRNWESPGYDADYVQSFYRNVSCLFKEAEDRVRKTIEADLKDKEYISEDFPNQYQIDLENPYDGLFVLEGRHFRYIVNESKKIFIDTDNLPIDKTENGAEFKVNPLPELMVYGMNMEEGGEWVGDIIRFSDGAPSDFLEIKISGSLSDTQYQVEGDAIRALKPYFKDVVEDAVSVLIHADTIDKRLRLIDFIETEPDISRDDIIIYALYLDDPDGVVSEEVSDGIHTLYEKEHPNDQIWWLRYYTVDDDGIYIPIVGNMDFTFDKKTIFSFWRDYPDKLTAEQKEIFDRENPYWANFRNHSKET